MSERRELIVYATPTGPFAAQCAAYFDRVTEELGPTTAQTYPPHVSLTGFFHRLPARADEVIVEMNAQIAAAGAVPAGAVEFSVSTDEPDWLGLHVTSRWLIDLTRALVERHRSEADDDELRPKDQLHLSLAYGASGPQPTLRRHAALARALIDVAAPVGWEAALWERTRVGGTDSTTRWTRW